MYEYAKLVLLGNNFGLTGCLQSYNGWCKRYFSLSPLTDCTISGFAFHCAHFLSKASYQHLKCEKIISCIKNGMIGGINTSICKYVEAKSQRLGDDVSDEETVELLHVDWCSQYLSLFGTKPLPYEDYRFLSQQELENFNIFNVNDTDLSYVCCVDLEYPNSIKEMSKWLPFVPTRVSVSGENDLESTDDAIPVNGATRVQLNQLDKTNVLLLDINLRFALKMGLILKRYHYVIC